MLSFNVPAERECIASDLVNMDIVLVSAWINAGQSIVSLLVNDVVRTCLKEQQCLNGMSKNLQVELFSLETFRSQWDIT